MDRPDILNYWSFKSEYDNENTLFSPAALSAAQRKAIRTYVEELEAENTELRSDLERCENREAIIEQGE